MKPTAALLLFISVAGSPLIGFADATQGEFLGYKLDDRYPVTDKTRWQINIINGKTYIVIAENPVKPGDIGEVRLLTTMKSFTIFNIYSLTTFETVEAAETFASEYNRILRARYAGEEITGYPGKHGIHITISTPLERTTIDSQYELTTFVTDDTPEASGPTFYMGLKSTESTSKLYEKEYNELVLEGAKEKGLLRGL